jgi:hypothetical protein
VDETGGVGETGGVDWVVFDGDGVGVGVRDGDGVAVGDGVGDPDPEIGPVEGDDPSDTGCCTGAAPGWLPPPGRCETVAASDVPAATTAAPMPTAIAALIGLR